ncbi:MAG: ABC-2 type transport system ATP-binding protein [Bradymonadia bacterium]|jgi:ABC-2 type transport system ATP-binding protein
MTSAAMNSAVTSALAVDGLTKSYGSHRAVDALSFIVPAGSLTALIGPNGAGKSTTMRILAGLQEQDSGTIRISGEDASGSLLARKTHCGITPQELAMFDFLSGRESLALVASVRGAGDVNAEIERWLRLTTLTDVADRLVNTYSGGMKRKLAVACALLTRPPLVILDESFTGLDPESTHALQAELRSYCEDGGAVLLSSHILDMLQVICDRAVVMRFGQHMVTLEGDEFKALANVPGGLTKAYLSWTQDAS